MARGSVRTPVTAPVLFWHTGLERLSKSTFCYCDLPSFDFFSVRQWKRFVDLTLCVPADFTTYELHFRLAMSMIKTCHKKGALGPTALRTTALKVQSGTRELSLSTARPHGPNSPITG